MTTLRVGEKICVRYVDGFSYIVHVQVIAICAFDEFIGRVEAIFADGGGEINAGEILRLKGQEKIFKISNIIT
jgi:hypothetical protein